MKRKLTQKEIEQHLITLEDEAKFFGFKTTRNEKQLTIKAGD